MTSGEFQGDQLPVYDAEEPRPPAVISTARRGGQARPRLPLGPGRGAGLAALVLVLLIAGIGLGGLTAPSHPSTSPLGSRSAPGPACRPLERDAVPVLVLGSTGSADTADGVVVRAPAPASGTQPAGWRLPPAGQDLRAAATDRLTLVNPLGICLASVAIDYLPWDGIPVSNAISQPTPQVLMTAPVDPPSSRVVLDGPPAGDWVLRVTSRFIGPDGTTATTMSYFRLLSGAQPSPSPRIVPLVTPAVPCNTAGRSSSTDVTLLVGDGPGIAGSPGSVPVGQAIPPDVPVVHVPAGRSAILVADGEACATAWILDYRAIATGATMLTDVQANPSEDPGVASQNRWLLRSPADDLLVVATFHFADEPDITRTWRVIRDPFVLPAAFVVGPDGARVAAGAGCGTSVTSVIEDCPAMLHGTAGVTNGTMRGLGDGCAPDRRRK